MSSFTYRVGIDRQRPVLSLDEDAATDSIIDKLKEKLEIKIISSDSDSIVFDLIGVDACIANSLRRIMLAEVPTMAVESIYIKDNTTVMQDEVLAHRIGLVPILADATKFLEAVEGSEPTEKDTLVFKLDVKRDMKTGEPNTVYSKDLVWIPHGDQESDHGKNSFKVVHNDIILAKLADDNRISLEAHCQKGIGKDHAKFSPCATASYRLLPEIRLMKPITDNLAKELKVNCPMDVFDIEDLKGIPTAKVARPRDCTMCRECIRKQDWSDGTRVQLHRVANHFIFSVETAGSIAPEKIVTEALKVLKTKALAFKDIVPSE